MFGILKFGAFLGLIAYSIGFLFGIVRTLVVLPILTQQWLIPLKEATLYAVVIEIPVMLYILWHVTFHFTYGRVQSQQSIVLKEMVASHALYLGLCAFITLLLCEFGFVYLLFTHSIVDTIQAFLERESLLGTAAQLAFGLMPLYQFHLFHKTKTT